MSLKISFYICAPQITSYDVCFLRYRVRQTIFCHLRPFLPFYPTKNPKNQNLENILKKSWRCYLFTHMYHKPRSHDGYFVRQKARRTETFVSLGHFLPFDPPNNQENQNFEKKEKKPGHIIISHICTINENHMMYASWDMKCNRHFFVIFNHFLHFYPTNNQKNQNLKKEKMSGDIILQKYNINGNHIMYGSRNIECDWQNFLSFWAIFCPFTPLTTHKRTDSKIKQVFVIFLPHAKKLTM